MPIQRDSEVRAYIFIEKNLQLWGWNTGNPERVVGGQLYTQQECLSHPEIKKGLGLQRPENVLIINEECCWVFESKASHNKINQALKEAERYAKDINSASSLIKAIVATGVAGNPTDGFLVKNSFWDGTSFKPITINGIETSGFLTPDEIHTLIESDSPHLRDIVISQELFIEKAMLINEYLHNGSINKDYRARIMAAILLSLLGDTQPNINTSVKLLIRDINSRAHAVLEDEGKAEFFRQIEILLPTSSDSYEGFKKSIVKTIQELNILNIRSAMNSGTDVLGEFYEVFLKYGNGAKEIGIVMTPRHITKFAAEALNPDSNDIILDPACGTGGFLVAAFDNVRKTATDAQINSFKKYNVFGIDQSPTVVPLAIVNMIFRGDGKNNIIEGDCFQRNLIRRVSKDGNITADYTDIHVDAEQKAVTKIFMNPPFKPTPETRKKKHFVDQALAQLVDGGILFSILPMSVMCDSNSNMVIWRREILLKNNTLLAVVSFHRDLFYPNNTDTLGVFLKKGIPHPKEQRVYWAKVIHDGYVIGHKARIKSPKESNELVKIISILQQFIINQDIEIYNISEFQKACPINFDDKLLELVPEVYLDSKRIDPEKTEKEIQRMARDLVLFKIRNFGRISSS